MIFDLQFCASSSLKRTQYLQTYLIVFATVYLHFYFLIFDIRRIFDVLRLFDRLVKFSASKNIFYYVLISMKHAFLLTVKKTCDVDNSLLHVYIFQATTFL